MPISWIGQGIVMIPQAQGGGGTTLNGRTVTGSGTLLSTDTFVYVNNTSGSAISLALPSSPAANQFLVVTDVAGNAATYNITLTGTVSGTTNPVIGANYASMGLSWSGSVWSQVF